MCTIFHEGHKLLIEAIGNRHYAFVADFLYFRIQGSQFVDENGNQYFVCPNVDYIVNETGYSSSLCTKALSDLAKNDFIKKVKFRCNDGAVRLKIFITEKLNNIMSEIAELVINKKKKQLLADIEEATSNDDSDSTLNERSIIKEENIKENNNINKSSKDDDDEPPKNGNQSSVKNVIFSFSLDLAEDSYEYQFVKQLADSYNLDFNDLLVALIELQELNVYSTVDDLIEDAISTLKRISGNKNEIPQAFSRIHAKKSVFFAEDYRDEVLTPKQQVALSQVLIDLTQSGKVCITNLAEVYNWIEYQLTNKVNHYVGKGFKHCINIVKKLLCNSGNRQYSKPFGYKESYSG